LAVTSERTLLAGFAIQEGNDLHLVVAATRAGLLLADVAPVRFIDFNRATTTAKLDARVAPHSKINAL
jgi:hypothetical protein